MSTSFPLETLQLQDGRKLAYAQFGAPGGAPLLYCHGFPSSRIEAALLDQPAKRMGIRIIAADRPGIGTSSRQSGRQMRHWPSDMAALADSLGIDRFHLIGVSGGGPYALSCLQALGTRIAGTSLVCPLGPVAEQQMLSSMNWPARHAFSTAMHHPFLSQTMITAFTAPLAMFWPEQLFNTLISSMPKVDRDVLSVDAVRRVFTASLSESMRNGTSGVQQDLDIYTSPWGFALDDLQHPVQLWHGTADAVVPIDHGQWISRQLPNCRAEFIEGAGHYSLPILQSERILERLLSA